MGKRHAAASAGIARAQVDETLREAEARRTAAETERQLLTSYLGTKSQVEGGAGFDGNPDVLKYTSRYALDERALREIQQSGAQVKGQLDPFQSPDNALRNGQDVLSFGQGFVTKANDLLAQAEAAARAGDLAGADRLYAQAQSIIGGVSPEARGAFNLAETPESAAKIRASSTEARVVGRQLLRANELGDPNSSTSQELRGRLLDQPIGLLNEGETRALGQIDESVKQAQTAIDENERNAERAIASERSDVEGQIRQLAAGGGVGFNARAQIATEARVASAAGLERAKNYSTSAAQRAEVLAAAGEERAAIITEASARRAAVTAQANQYLNDFAAQFAVNSVALAQGWVNGTAGVRDVYQESLIAIDQQRAEFMQDWANILFEDYRQQRQLSGFKKQSRRDGIAGILTGILPLTTLFGGPQPQSNGGPNAQPIVGGGSGSGVGGSEGSDFGLGALSTSEEGSGGGGLSKIAAVGSLFG